jgi:hypothetical protein
MCRGREVSPQRSTYGIAHNGRGARFLICGHLWADHSHFLDQLAPIGPPRRTVNPTRKRIPPIQRLSHIRGRIQKPCRSLSLHRFGASGRWRHTRPTSVLARNRNADRVSWLPAAVGRGRDRVLDEIRQLAPAQPPPPRLSRHPRLPRGPRNVHRHCRSPRMDGIGAAIWASRTTVDLAPRQALNVG